MSEFNEGQLLKESIESSIANNKLNGNRIHITEDNEAIEIGPRLTDKEKAININAINHILNISAKYLGSTELSLFYSDNIYPLYRMIKQIYDLSDPEEKIIIEYSISTLSKPKGILIYAYGQTLKEIFREKVDFPPIQELTPLEQ